jgi:hypothetical protein
MSNKRWLINGLTALCIVIVLAWWAALVWGAAETLF